MKIFELNWVIIFLVLVLTNSCGSGISPGNVGRVAYIETNLKYDIMGPIIDTLTKNGKYAVPEKYKKDVEIEYLSNITNYYFHDYPKEVYIATDYIRIRFVYSFETKVREYDNREVVIGLKNRDDVSEQEVNRIKKRFENTVLKDVKLKAKELGIPDSVLYQIN